MKKSILCRSNRKAKIEPMTNLMRCAIVGALHNGYSPVEVAHELDIPTMRVAAVKAHITMGSYQSYPL